MSSPPTQQPAESPLPSGTARSLRLAIVTRRFWPYSGTTELAIGDLASEIKRLGHAVEIVTIRWEKIWPSYFQFQEFPVHRINRPGSNPWGSYRYLRSLTRKLVELELDGIIVFGLGDEAWAVSKTFVGKIPYVIRVGNDVLVSGQHQEDFLARQVSAINGAASVLVDSNRTLKKIQNDATITNESIFVVEDGIQINAQQERTATDYGASRVAISDAHPVLMIGPTQPLVVCGAPMNGDFGMIDLINAWPRVLDRFPKARLWIIGDGRKGREVWDKLQDKDLVNSVIMPGSFDDLSDVLQAADVYVHPLRSDESCGFLARALAAGVCSVVTSTSMTRAVVDNNVNALVVGIEDPRAIGDAINLALSNQELRERLGRAALKSAVSAYDIKRLIHHFLDPMHALDDKPSESATQEQATNSSSPL